MNISAMPAAPAAKFGRAASKDEIRHIQDMQRLVHQNQPEFPDVPPAEQEKNTHYFMLDFTNNGLLARLKRIPEILQDANTITSAKLSAGIIKMKKNANVSAFISTFEKTMEKFSPITKSLERHFAQVKPDELLVVIRDKS